MKLPTSWLTQQLDRSMRAAQAVPEWAVAFLPGPQGRAARSLYWAARMRHVGRKVTFGIGVQVVNPEFVSIGDNTWIDDYVILLAGPPGERAALTHKPNAAYTGAAGELRIGRNCHIAPHVVIQAHGGVWIGDGCGVASGARIYSLSHHYRNSRDPADARVYKFSPRVPAEEQALIASPTVMEDATAVALNSILLPGATLREGAWLGVLSATSGEVPANTVASGNPAKVVKAIR